ncbi:hypothetical protein L9F63_013667 [Diploptera punctata]|uniref:G-protein coupled receptors family 1 profile domain-containing protein n=1 Tax=Diploptera punctata TaxID=6984 RepID=A0AAD8A9P8_DIPPU|nr:hypothetical protein L9F63_013667 [Diploptera punctata]
MEERKDSLALGCPNSVGGIKKTRVNQERLDSTVKRVQNTISNMLSRFPAGIQTSELCGNTSQNTTQEFEDAMSDLRWVAYRVVMPVIIAGGLLGNLLNLVVLTRPSLKGVTYVYLSGLAVADLGVMMCVIPMAVRLSKSHGHSYFAAFFHAHIELAAINSLMASSIFNVVCLTVDRYISVCLPTKFRSVHTRRNAHLAVAGSYLLAIAISCPLTALNEVCIVEETHFAFQENIQVTSSFAWLVYLWTSETTVRFGPALMLAVLNTLIIRKFLRLTRKRRKFRATTENLRAQNLLDTGQQGTMRNKNYHEERRLVILLTSIMHLFFLTMTPSAFLSLLYSEQRERELGFQAFRAAANNLELCNFALNFYIYFLCSKEFRHVFMRVFSCCPAIHQEKPVMQEDEGNAHDMKDFSRNGTTVRPSPDNTQHSDKFR